MIRRLKHKTLLVEMLWSEGAQPGRQKTKIFSIITLATLRYFAVPASSYVGFKQPLGDTASLGGHGFQCFLPEGKRVIPMREVQRLGANVSIVGERGIQVSHQQ